MKTNPLTPHPILKHSHSNLIFFHVDIVAIIYMKWRRLHGGHIVVTLTSLCVELVYGSRWCCVCFPALGSMGTRVHGSGWGAAHGVSVVAVAATQSQDTLHFLAASCQLILYSSVCVCLGTSGSWFSTKHLNHLGHVSPQARYIPRCQQYAEAVVTEGDQSLLEGLIYNI